MKEETEEKRRGEGWVSQEVKSNQEMETKLNANKLNIMQTSVAEIAS